MKTEPTTLVTWAAAIARMLAAKGCDPAALFAAAGLDLARMNDPDRRYPLSGMTRLWDEAVRATGDPCLGLELPRYVQPATWHALGLSVLASETLYDAVTRSARFSRLVTDAADVNVVRLADAVAVVYGPPRGGHLAADAAYDAFIATMVQTARVLSLNDRVAPRSVELRRAAPPSGAERYAAFFRCEVRFGRPENRLIFSLADALAPLPMANAQLVRQNDQVVTEYLARFDRGQVVHQVRDQIVKRLPSGEPSQADIARALNLSLRSLQRRLRGEGTSYSDLLEETRRELAAQYLKQSRTTLCEITYLLGFADQSNFTRAFKRWNGVAPGEFRERHRAGA